MHSGFSSIYSRESGQGPLISETSFPGLAINYVLWGVQITQSYYYYKSYRKTDIILIKIAVGLLFIVEALQTICVSAFCWRFMVQGLTPLPETTTGRAINMIPILDTLTASIVHIIYAEKIWSLLGHPYKYPCTAAVLALSTLQLTAGLGNTIFINVIDITFGEIDRLKTWALIWPVSAALADILITICMTWRLSEFRSGVKSTDNIISKLIQIIVETGLALTVVNIAPIVLYLGWPLKSYNYSFTYFLPKVYSNSMLALLNSRKSSDANGSEMEIRCHICRGKATSDSVHFAMNSSMTMENFERATIPV